MSGENSTQLKDVIQWARASSIWYYVVSGSCCADEVLSSQGCRYDLERFGCLPQAHPEQADLLIVNAVITERLAPVIREVYDRMPTPKYVMSIGACTNSTGAFDNVITYTGARPLDEVIPVDVYVPGCPPRPEAIMNGLIRLQERILRGQEGGVSVASPS